MIGKKISAPLRVVSIHDDAVDWSQTPKLEYQEKRDPEMVKLLPGQEATWFTLTPLSPGVISYMDQNFLKRSKRAAFQFGVSSCSHAKELGLKWDHTNLAVLKDEVLAAIPAKVIDEIGSVVLQREDMTEGEEPRFSR